MTATDNTTSKFGNVNVYLVLYVLLTLPKLNRMIDQSMNYITTVYEAQI